MEPLLEQRITQGLGNKNSLEDVDVRVRNDGSLKFLVPFR
jgi:hypothetical protein